MLEDELLKIESEIKMTELKLKRLKQKKYIKKNEMRFQKFLLKEQQKEWKFEQKWSRYISPEYDTEEWDDYLYYLNSVIEKNGYIKCI